jgi:hypothetical protein
MSRLSRLLLSAACPLLAIAQLSGFGGKWMIPLVALCGVNAIITVAEQRRRADGHVTLNLHQ